MVVNDVDTHTWTEKEVKCHLSVRDGTTHFMKCSVCGLERLGPYSEPGCWHFFEFVHPDGEVSGFPPPCQNIPDDHHVIKIRLCGQCRTPRDPSQDQCELGCKDDGDPIILEVVVKKDPNE